MIRILVADDNALIQDGISLRLKNDNNLKIIGKVPNGLKAVEFCKNDPPDVVLMDINMPHMDGLEATKRIKDLDPTIKVLILTSYADPENLEKAKANRCNGFIYKETSLEDFRSVIRSVYNGYDVWTSGLLQESARNAMEDGLSTEELELLEPKEIELVRCKVKCMKYSEIAQSLNYSETYVRQMAVGIKEKLGLRNVNEIAVWGAKRNL